VVVAEQDVVAQDLEVMEVLVVAEVYFLLIVVGQETLLQSVLLKEIMVVLVIDQDLDKVKAVAVVAVLQPLEVMQKQLLILITEVMVEQVQQQVLRRLL
tara:strand:- start:221 stop:517 length:297 start_codon:yes stop_codon:yes gene_type:complete